MTQHFDPLGKESRFLIYSKNSLSSTLAFLAIFGNVSVLMNGLKSEDPPLRYLFHGIFKVVSLLWLTFLFELTDRRIS